MIARYQTKEIASIFSEENRLALYIEIEALLLEELSKCYPIQKNEIRLLRNLKTKINTAKIGELESKTRHDITAFLHWVWQCLPKARGVQQYLHLGLTSSDLVDTALAIQMRQALALILKEIEKNIELLQSLSQKYKDLPIIGRTHGIHAEITSLGLKFLSFFCEGTRCLKRLEAAYTEISYGKLSGSVGNFASSAINPKIEKAILSKLCLEAEPVATQIIPRDRHAVVIIRLALFAGWIERIAIEIRHLQRSEVGELAEPFKEGSQQGSSSMPHKKNPVLCENLCGLARLMRGFSLTSMENTGLWHERDISHSSAERVLIPDAFHIAHFMSRRLHEILAGMFVNTEKIKKNIYLLKDLPASQKYLNELVVSGVARPDAYRLLQKASFNAVKNGSTIADELKKDSRLPKNIKIKNFEPKEFLSSSEPIFKRAGLL